MTAAELFRLTNGLAFPGWLPLILAPRWRWTVPAAHGLSCLFCLVSVIVPGWHWGEGEGGLALWRVTPCLPLTFLFGPAGLGLFYLLNGDRDAFGVAAQK